MISPVIAMLSNSVVLTGTQPHFSDNSWYMDSGAPHHFTPEFGHLAEAMPYTGTEQALMGNGKLVGISHIDRVQLLGSVKSISLNHVLHTPEISEQPISVTKLCVDNNAF